MASAAQSEVIHIINDNGIGGAQKTLRQIARPNHIVMTLRPNLLMTTMRLFRVIAKTKGRVILFSWMYHSILVSCFVRLWFGKRCVHIANVRNGYADPSSLKMTTRAIMVLTNLIAKRAVDKFVFCSESAMQDHHKNKFFIRNSVYVRNGIDKKEFVTNRTFATKPRFACVARFESQKNFGLLKTIIPFFEDNGFTLKILTDQKQSAKLFLGLSEISEVKVYDNKDMSARQLFDMSECHLLVSRSEGFANVHLEALARGCDIVSTNVGDAHVFPAHWVYLLNHEQTNLIETLQKYLSSYDATQAQQELNEKLHYLEQSHLPKTFEDYV